VVDGVTDTVQSPEPSEIGAATETEVEKKKAVIEMALTRRWLLNMKHTVPVGHTPTLGYAVGFAHRIAAVTVYFALVAKIHRTIAQWRSWENTVGCCCMDNAADVMTDGATRMAGRTGTGAPGRGD
jgi:hypothetical protein